MAVTFNSFGFNGGGTGGGGSPGPPGTPGSVWRNGSGLPSPALGINGDYYLNDDDGEVYQKVGGIYTSVANIKGANGTNGTNGSVWYAGNGAPSPSPSYNQNDFYLNNLNGDVFRYDGAAWQPETNIDGTDGVNGSVWYADNGFPPPAGSYNTNDFYLDNDTSQVYQYDGSTWNPQVNIKGANGTQWYTASGVPTTTYNDGDFYLNATNGDVWEQVGGSWTNTGTNIKGANGTNGADGSLWYSGAVFPPTSPPTYNPNDLFLDTTDGNVYQYDGSTWNLQLNITGASGIAGSVWYNDNGAPTTLYSDGDYYLDDLTGDVYEQQSGAWVLIGNIKGAQGVPGQDGASSSYFFYRTKTIITSGDPLATHVRWNQTAQTTSTELGISVDTDDSVDVSIFLGLLQVGDNIIIQEKDNSANFQTWEVSGAITNNTTWVSVPVTNVDSGGTGTSNFANNLPVILATTREGTAGLDGANSTRYNYDNTTVAPAPPSGTAFATDNADLTFITSLSVDAFNQDTLDFTQWWLSLYTWFDTKAPLNNYLQIREVGTTNVIGAYEIINVKDFGTYFTFDLLFLAGFGTLSNTKTYVLSYSLAGSSGNQGINGVAAANSVGWFASTNIPPLSQSFNYQGTGSLASTITSFEINDVDGNNVNEFTWLEYARTTALAGGVGILSIAAANSPSEQAIFTISSVVDNTGYHTFNVSFLGGYDVDFSTLVAAPDLCIINYIFNGVGGGGTITVKYPDNSTIVDSAVNTMVFTGGGVNVTSLSAGNVEINIPSGGSDGSIVASIRSLSSSTTLSPFVVGALTIPYNGTLTGWTIFSDVSGSCTVDFKSGSYASYPPSASIFSGNAPNLVSDVKNQLGSLSIPVTQGDVLLCDLTAISGSMSRIDVTLLITKS